MRGSGRSSGGAGWESGVRLLGRAGRIRPVTVPCPVCHPPPSSWSASGGPATHPGGWWWGESVGGPAERTVTRDACAARLGGGRHPGERRGPTVRTLTRTGSIAPAVGWIPASAGMTVARRNRNTACAPEAYPTLLPTLLHRHGPLLADQPRIPSVGGGEKAGVVRLNRTMTREEAGGPEGAGPSDGTAPFPPPLTRRRRRRRCGGRWRLPGCRRDGGQGRRRGPWRR